jgi:Flp pilus assembly protein TadG
MVISRLNAKAQCARDAIVGAVHRLSRRFKRDRSGIAAVEFALLLPIMIGLYVGGIEITDAFTIKRKIAGVASTLSDLVARTKTITLAEMQNILDASEAGIAPYAADELKVRVSGVWIDDKLVAKVVWSAARNETALKEGGVVSLPAGVKTANSFLVVSLASYQYTPPIGYVITGDLDFSDAFFLTPRLSNTICYDGKCDLN